jgi:integrase
MLNDQTIRDLPVPATRNKVYFFAHVRIGHETTPRGFGIQVTATGQRSFVMRYRNAGGRERQITIGRWPDWRAIDAVLEARKLRHNIDRGEDVLAAREQQHAKANDTLAAICEDYLGRSKLRSVDKVRSTLERLVYPELGERYIGDIKRSDVTRLLDGIDKRNGPVMADRTLAAIRVVFNWYALRTDDFVSPVVRGMARTSTTARARTKILDDAELSAVWRAAERGGPFGRLVRFILLTGARPSEASELPWSEIRDDLWTLPPERNKVKQVLLRPLILQAAELLSVISGTYVFSSDGGRIPIRGLSGMRAQLQKASRTAGWTLHDLRRTSRSLMSRAGVPPDHAERCLGHVIGGVRGTYDRYEYLAEKRAAYLMLAGLIERIVNPADNVLPLSRAR